MSEAEKNLIRPIPDLWHVAMFLRDRENKGEGAILDGKPLSDAVLECWHYCHDLRAAMQDVLDEAEK